MQRPSGQPVAGDPKWIAYNKFKGTPKEKKKQQEFDALVELLCKEFGGYVVNK